MPAYCVEADVVSLLGQAGVDLRQDDLVPLYPQTFTSAAFTQPASSGTVVVSVGNGLWAAVAQNVHVAGGGRYVVTALSASTVTLRNDGAAGNTSSGSSIGYPARVSASPPAGFLSASYLDDAIDRGSQEVDEHCAMFYSAARLGESDWVAKHAAVLSAFFFCLRRGNPPPAGIAMMRDETMAKLARVQGGQLMIPRLPRSKACVPVMSNMRPALRPHPHTVVERKRSTGTPADYHQNGDPWDITGINNSYIYDYSLAVWPLAGFGLALLASLSAYGLA